MTDCGTFCVHQFDIEIKLNMDPHFNLERTIKLHLYSWKKNKIWYKKQKYHPNIGRKNTSKEKHHIRPIKMFY